METKTRNNNIIATELATEYKTVLMNIPTNLHRIL